MSPISLNLVLSKQDFAILDGRTAWTRFVPRTLQLYLVWKLWFLYHQTKAESSTTEQKSVFYLSSRFLNFCMANEDKKK